MHRAVLFLLAAGCGDGALRADSPFDIMVVDSQLFWREQSGSLRVASLDGSNARTVASPPLHGACVGRLQTNHTRIFWNDCETNLWSAALDGSDPIAHGIRAGWTFAVDDDRLYATTPRDTVSVTSLGGGDPSPLFAGMSVSGIASVGNSLYLAAGGSAFDPSSTIDQNGIWRVPIEGGTPTQLMVDRFAPWELLVYGPYVFWTDYDGGLFRANLDGTDRTTIDGERCFSVRIRDGKLFYLRDESPGAELLSAQLDGSDKRVLTSDASYVVGLGVGANDVYLWHTVVVTGIHEIDTVWELERIPY